MEHIAKNLPTLTSRLGIGVDKNTGKYRQLIFGVLERLESACIEITEGDERCVLGNRSSDIVGQIVVHDPSFYRETVCKGSIGAAEAFIDGKWTSPNLTIVVQIMARNQTQLDSIDNNIRWLHAVKNWFLRKKNANSEAGSKRNILAHYDLGNDLYSRFLDSSMQYSSAIYSEQASELSQAQQNKMRTICESLELSSEDKVIEIGTGWGGLAIYMAQHYGCHVTTTTISDAQFEYAQNKITALGLSERITLLKQDYRQLQGCYDKLVSIEMIEAVGHEYLPNFFDTCSNLLKDDGKMLLQSITIADSRYDTYRKGVDFIQKYIFPGGCLPSIAVLSKAIAANTDMVIHHISDIGLHYARTLHDWRTLFEKQWKEINLYGYDEQFKRLWLFYFCYCEGAFLERVISTHHIVARKPRYRGKYDETVLVY
ncbi:cyclopropane-fatty-acyl-phospholipid synthase family protein [Vibrio sp. S4M6]|uniref:SAM-dependent methyltransferase n=1 Tax=Vibrio sinus TaxID=2946865 RepID=UPI00202A509B|nr:cyclopropane-fatty-acyl-phospholipid synthase family protein [Vibrio sinus]MCL9782369.1 cyclopropane-fatty-acyl-phospholipid synthase family protein [Vibrio sinus]